MVSDFFEGIVFFTSYTESHSYDLCFPGGESIKNLQYLLCDHILFRIGVWRRAILITNKVLEF